MLKINALIVLSLLCSISLAGCSSFNSDTSTPSENNTVISELNTSDMVNNLTDIELKNDSTTSNNDEFDKSLNLITDNIGVPVLYYHSVNDTVKNEVTISPDLLRKELQYIKDEGYTALTIRQLTNYLLNDSPIPEKSVVITFDDGYMDNYSNAFPILKELNMTATIFCITSELDGSYYLSEDAIKEMSDYGIDIESHTVNHLHLNTLSFEDQLKELKDSKATLESITGKDVTSIAFPFGDYNEDSVKAAKESGYTLAFTTNKGLSDRNDNPLELDRVYISSEYDLNTFESLLKNTDK